MRTTITLDPDTAAFLQRQMRRRGLTFKQAVNDAIRAGMGDQQREVGTFRTPAVAMGTPAVNLDRALQVVGDLEDDELIRRMRVGK